MAQLVRGVVRDHPRSTTAEVVALTYQRLDNWGAEHTHYPAPSGVTPLHGLRKLERTGRAERVRDGGFPRWVSVEPVEPVAVGRWGRIEGADESRLLR